jgi:hypothetical protein
MTAMKTNFFIAKIAVSGEGGVAHEHATYLRRLMDMIRQAIRNSNADNRRIAEGLAAADAFLARHREID